MRDQATKEDKNDVRLALGFSLGLAVMYLLDPDAGNRRRSLLRDKLYHYGKEGRRQAELTWTDVSNRVRGQVATARSRMRLETVSDDVLVARCASKVGRLVSNPHPIGITAEDGIVFLSGPVFSDEIPHLLKIISEIPGVRQVDSSLEPHDRDHRVRELQNHELPRDLRSDYPVRLTPAARLFLGVSTLIGVSTGVIANRGRKAA